MINARKKGQRNELKSRRLLEQEGWLVEQARGSTKWNKNVDLFGLFDLIGLRKINITTGIGTNLITQFIFVQVKSNRISKQDKNKIKEFKDKYLDDICQVEVHIWKDRKGLKRIAL